MNAHGEQQTFFNWNGGEPNNFTNNKQDGEPNVEMLLSGNANQNGKWNDMYNHASTQKRVNYSKNNLVVCTYVVPGTEPVTECGYGWEAHQTSQGRKCLQVKFYPKMQRFLPVCAFPSSFPCLRMAQMDLG